MVRYIGVQRDSDFRNDTSAALTSGTAQFLDQTSEDISVDMGLIFPETSAQRVMRNRIPGQIGISGDIQVPFYSRGTPTLIYYGLGAEPESDDNYDLDGNGAVTGLFEHVLRASFDELPPTFRMGVGKDLKEHRFNGCCVQTMTFDFDPSESVLVTFGVMARREVTAGDLATLPSDFGDYNEAERVVSGTEMEVKAKFGSDAEAVVNSLESMTIEVDNGYVDDNFVIGSKYIPEKYVQNHTVSGSLEFGYDSYDRYKSVIDEDVVKVELASSKSSLAAKTDEEHRFIKVELPQVALMNVSLPTEGTDRYILSIDYQGERDDTDTSNPDDLIVVTVRNEQTKAQLQA